MNLRVFGSGTNETRRPVFGESRNALAGIGGLREGEIATLLEGEACR
jgi:hypothetical protein